MKKTAAIALALFMSFAQAQDEKQSSASIHMELAVSYFNSGRIAVAMEEVNRVLKEEPGNSKALTMAGVILLRQAELARAEEYFRSAIAADGNNGDAKSNYGILLCQRGRFDEGVEQFGKAMAVPKYAKTSETLINAGVCLMKKNDMPAAEKYFFTALEVEPGMAMAHFQLARLYIRTNRISDAEARITWFHRMTPPSSASLFMNAVIANSKGQSKDVLKISRQIADMFPQSAEAEKIMRRDFTLN